ncbi:MAG TPA: ATP phosphoribosyltransferase regulatory subunit [Longimicrobiaceae bacterium]|nr:ATP phosphoribosyltransferase regulatory subunit [Longimicrobiaceae bacterium]
MPNERISRIPPGSQDLLAGDVRRRRQVQAAWFQLAEGRGYEEVIPPTFEYEEVFTLGAGPDLSSRLVRFVDHDGRLVALRADFTSSIARMAATKLARAPLPLRLSYAGKVYRQALDGAGDRREVFQLGAELIGAGDPEADVEAIRLVLDTLQAISIEDFQINLGEMGFIQPLLRELSEEQGERAREAIDRKDRAALAALAAEPSLPREIAEALAHLPELIGRSEVLDRASVLAVGDGGRSAIERLRAIDRLLSPSERERIVYDLGEIRGLGYYTGIRFEVFVAGAGRAVGSGGRYDRLFGLYGMDRPAVGFALETDTLAELLGTGGR